MKVIDISKKLDDFTPVYEGDPHFVKEVWKSIEKDGFMLSKIRMGTHTGTHIDAPCHYLEGGTAVCDIPASVFVGECEVVEKIEDATGKFGRVIFKSADRLTEKEAELVVKKKIRLIGTSSLSVGGDEVHRMLLGSDCIILETLELSKVAPGKYLLSALPLKIDADGCPVRACLISED